MKPCHPLILAAFLAASPGLHAQVGGDLTPPGAPAPTMKTLDQIEARTPLVAGAPGVSFAASGTATISLPGSYVLMGPLTVTGGDGLLINASQVTLDLNGFEIRSTSATAEGAALRLQGSNIRVYNGHVASGVTYDPDNQVPAFQGSGFVSGILAVSEAYANISVRDMSLGGFIGSGINLWSHNSLVESCTVRVAGSLGIRASLVRGSAAEICGNDAISALSVENSRGRSVGGHGISAGTISNCLGVSSSPSPAYHGINGSTIGNSIGESAGGCGIHGGMVQNSRGLSTGTDNASHGIFGITVSHSFGQNQFEGGGDGIQASIISHSRGVSVTEGDRAALRAEIAIGCTYDGNLAVDNTYQMN